MVGFDNANGVGDEGKDAGGTVFSQRRHLNRKNVEPVKQVAPENARNDASLQVTVSSSNQPNVASDGPSSTDTLKFVFLQDSQQSDLGFGWKVSNFVEEDRASFGKLKAPYPPLSCPRKSALLMAEQF
jgi:hypothetical protein